MIPLQRLSALVTQKTKDASLLLAADRHANAVYLMGYAVEIALKRRLVIETGFTHGFPETRQEFEEYADIIDALTLQTPLQTIRDIRNHDLNKLLLFTSIEQRIKGEFRSDWSIISEWNPQNRYRMQRFTQLKAHSFMKSALKIINKINTPQNEKEDC